MTEVLSLMLYSYAFMVSGLLVPVIAGLFFNQRNPQAAVASMIAGGSLTAGLSLFEVPLAFGLDANLFGLLLSLATFIAVILINKNTKELQKHYD
jgi:SSS family solute:Na+ symporter